MMTGLIIMAQTSSLMCGACTTLIRWYSFIYFLAVMIYPHQPIKLSQLLSHLIFSYSNQLTKTYWRWKGSLCPGWHPDRRNILLNEDQQLPSVLHRTEPGLHCLQRAHLRHPDVRQVRRREVIIPLVSSLLPTRRGEPLKKNVEYWYKQLRYGPWGCLAWCPSTSSFFTLWTASSSLATCISTDFSLKIQSGGQKVQNSLKYILKTTLWNLTKTNFVSNGVHLFTCRSSPDHLTVHWPLPYPY